MLPYRRVSEWLQDCREFCDMQVEEIPWRQSAEWKFDGSHLSHKTGGFFRVVGATVLLEGKRLERLDQPLIDQPEIGILGFLARRTGGETEILVQAKPEPGNVGLVQAAPSVQATMSNYRKVHHGKDTLFLEYFLNPRAGSVLSESLQSEQGTRFLSKFNRNMIVEVPGDLPVPDSSAFKWVPLADLNLLLNQDFQVNTDARSVLTCGPWSLLGSGSGPFAQWRDQGGLGEALLRSYETPEETGECTTGEIIGRLHALRSTVRFDSQVLGLPELAGWEFEGDVIRSSKGTPLEVRQFKVASSDREVDRWDQPLMSSSGQGRAMLLCQERGGVLHFLFNCRAEIGFRQRFEYGPTIQDPDGDTFILPSLESKENEVMELAEGATELLSNDQSDEGGRFYRCVSRYSIRMLDREAEVDTGSSLSWFTLRQVESLAKRPGIFSNEARSLISMFLPYL